MFLGVFVGVWDFYYGVGVWCFGVLVIFGYCRDMLYVGVLFSRVGL